MNRILDPIVLALLVTQFPLAAAEVVVDVSSSSDPIRIAVNVGDTVAWQEASGTSAHRIVSYTGEWESPPLSRADPLFKFKFEEAGFYGYRALLLEGTPPYNPRENINNIRFTVGTVNVMPWSNAPPLVTLNSPVERTRFGSSYVGLPGRGGYRQIEYVPMLVSVNERLGEVERVEFYSGTNFLGVATKTPYQLLHTNAALGINLVSAKAVGKEGQEEWSQPVTITVEESQTPKLYNPRIVRGRMFVVDYVHGPLTSYGLFRADQVGTYWGRENLAVKFQNSGTFADDAVTNQMKFYWWFEAQP